MSDTIRELDMPQKKGINTAAALAVEQLKMAYEVLKQSGVAIPQSPENVLKVAQLIATNRASLS